MADVKMPKLGESVTEGTLGKWLKKLGESVQKYEPLVEVVTDKVNAEIPSDFDGTLAEILVAENETVSVGTVIARIMPAGAGLPPESSRAPKGSGRYSPAVLKLAAEHRVDLQLVPGTGLGGRITRKDVLDYLNTGVVKRSPADTGKEPADPDILSAGREESLSVTPVRRTIARRMVESRQTAPHAWVMVEVDATPVVKVREKHMNEFREKEGVELTFLPFFINAAVEALKEFPLVNSTWAEDRIIIKKDVHISIAVATPDALAVPVIHHADRLSILGLAKSVSDLARRARANQLTLEDVQGGTFTVNNTGAFGSVLSQPIINAPQAAILTVEAIVKRPVVQKDDSIAIRSMVNLCMSLDHRILDGWVSGQFLRAVKERIESMDDRSRLY